MNIKSRIKNLEERTNTGEFCTCETNKTEIYLRSVNESKRHLSGEPVPDICELCRKPVNKMIIEIIGVDAGMKTEVVKPKMQNIS